FEQALSFSDSKNAPDNLKIPFGERATSQQQSAGIRTQGTGDDNGVPLNVPSKETPTDFKETDGFDGDRSLANSILFLQDFGWWIELAYAIPEGDIGRVFEVLKVWIFIFCGSSHQNYTSYLLEVYCLLRYDSSKDLKDAILNNWLVNITGEAGKWIGADLLQKHYNRWLEDMLYEEENLHLFCAGRSQGHAAANQFNNGYEKLNSGKMDDFILKSTLYADVIADVQVQKRATEGMTELDTKMRELHLEETDSEKAHVTSSTGPQVGSQQSESGSRSDSSQTSSNSFHDDSSVQSNELETTDDPSNNQLVSGSEHGFQLEGNDLTHREWYDGEDSDYGPSSDEEDVEESEIEERVLDPDGELDGHGFD
ncbi:hypothetical protein CPC08DRAFT_639202, partial [Agrocybe pediades]